MLWQLQRNIIANVQCLLLALRQALKNLASCQWSVAWSMKLCWLLTAWPRFSQMLLQLIDVPTEFPTPPQRGLIPPPTFAQHPRLQGERREKGKGRGEASKKIWDAYLLLQPLKLANSNLVHNSDLGSSLTRNNFYDQNQLISAATY